MLAGSYEGDIDGEEVRVGAGDFLWIPARAPHRLVSKRPITKYFLRLRMDLGIPKGRPIIRRLGEEAAVWCQTLISEEHARDELSESRVRALVVLLLSAWMRADSSPTGGLGAERRAALLRAVSEDPARRWTRGELARLLGISGLHLSRQVRKTFGMPLRQWLVETRIRAAAHSLREDAGSIGTIAVRFGYGDLFLFSRQFSRVMGLSPRAWRNAQ